MNNNMSDWTRVTVHINAIQSENAQLKKFFTFRLLTAVLFFVRLRGENGR